jgi:hypothetical protein
MQKIAGILKEDIYEADDQAMPDGISLEFIADVGDIEETSGPAQAVAKKTAQAFKKQGYGNINVSKLAEDLFRIDSDATHVFVMGKSAPSANEIYAAYKSGDTDGAFDMVERAAGGGADLDSQIKSKVQYYYGDENPTPEQVAKLVAIYKHQMENEERTDVEDFFMDLEDSSDPDAFVSLRDLKKYKGY